MKRHTRTQDSFHPNGVLAGDRIIGTWDRRGGHVSVKVDGRLSTRTLQAIEAEALSFPMAGPSVDIADC